MPRLHTSERLLLAAVLAMLAFAVGGPWVAQPEGHHHFADQRVWGGIPCAMDVLSNLPFAIWGALGLAISLLNLRAKPYTGTDGQLATATQQGLAALFFVGLLITAGVSSWYHLRPDDAGLVLDRLGMTVAFAGLLGLTVAGRVSARAGVVLAAAVLVLGPASMAVWTSSGNILPWAVLQFGGMAMVLGLAFAKPLPGALSVSWAAVIAIYAVAKVFELADHAIFEWTGHLVSGHSLKHLVASFAAWPVLMALKKAAAPVQACQQAGQAVQLARLKAESYKPPGGRLPEARAVNGGITNA